MQYTYSRETIVNSAAFDGGTYYIGDLCYVLDDEEWEEVCHSLGKDGTDYGAKTLSNGKRIFIAGTCYGDGAYKGNDGNEYLVDSGTIGLILAKDISKAHDNGGHNTIFKHRFIAKCDDGVFTFDELKINTRDEPSEEED